MESLIFVVLAGLSVGFLVWLLFNTDALYHYGTLPGVWYFTLFLELQEYWEWKKQLPIDQEHFYPVFYRERHNNFWSHLIGCFYCLTGFISVWGCIIGGIWWPIFLLGPAVGAVGI